MAAVVELVAPNDEKRCSSKCTNIGFIEECFS